MHTPTSTSDPVQSSRREDIQLLRALAVSLVVLFHSGIVPVPAGFLGVDVFFVISGFLITSHIVRDIDRGAFSQTEFYFRRAKRLLPATYCTLSFTALAAYFLLLPSDWTGFLKQLLGGLTFTANIFLWLQTGYFEGASATKPLLHLWSLSVEEQYYLLLPFLLSLSGFRWRPWVILITFVLSAASYYYLTATDPTAAFFLLPSRAWELLLGSLAAELVARHERLDFPLALKVAALAAVAFVPVLSFVSAYPFAYTLVVTVSTAILLIGRNRWLEFGVVTRWLSMVGDWSYSIYLVHWPLFAFTTVLCVGSVPPVVSACLIPVSYALGYLQYQYVEQPFRAGGRTNPQWYLAYLAIASLVLATPIPAHFFWRHGTQPGTDFSSVVRLNTGLDSSSVCDQNDNFDDTSRCRLPGIPQVALWGDSNAMQWGAGLAATLDGSGLVQMTKSDCGPVRGVSLVTAGYPKSWADKCIRFSESAFKYVSDNPSIHTVVLASAFNEYIPSEGMQQLIGDRLQPIDIQVSAEKLSETIASLRAIGKRVIVIAPAPRVTFDIGACRVRRASGLPVFVAGRTDCNFNLADYAAKRESIIRLLKIAESKSGSRFIWPETATCVEGVCATQLGQTILYRDASHLTYDGSILLARMLHLGAQLAASKP